MPYNHFYRGIYAEVWKGLLTPNRHFWLRQELKKCKCLFVRSSDEKCSRAHIVHLSLSGQSQVDLRLVSG